MFTYDDNPVIIIYEIILLFYFCNPDNVPNKNNSLTYYTTLKSEINVLNGLCNNLKK